MEMNVLLSGKFAVNFAPHIFVVIIHVDTLAQLLLLLPLLLLVVCLLLLLRLQPSKLVNLNFEFGPSLCCAVLSCALLHFYLRVLQAFILLHEGILHRVCIMKRKGDLCLVGCICS